MIIITIDVELNAHKCFGQYNITNRISNQMIYITQNDIYISRNSVRLNVEIDYCRYRFITRMLIVVILWPKTR